MVKGKTRKKPVSRVVKKSLLKHPRKGSKPKNGKVSKVRKFLSWKKKFSNKKKKR